MGKESLAPQGIKAGIEEKQTRPVLKLDSLADSVIQPGESHDGLTPLERYDRQYVEMMRNTSS